MDARPTPTPASSMNIMQEKKETSTTTDAEHEAGNEAALPSALDVPDGGLVAWLTIAGAYVSLVDFFRLFVH